MKARRAIAMMMPGTRAANGEPERYFREVVLLHDSEECLMWPFAKASKGYGQVRIGGVLHNVHRLVCETINGSEPELEAAHSCGVRLCCNRRHLSWKTPKANNADKLLHGTHQFGERNAQAKLTDSGVRRILELAGNGLSQRAIATQLGVCQATVSRVVNGLIWTKVAA